MPEHLRQLDLFTPYEDQAPVMPVSKILPALNEKTLITDDLPHPEVVVAISLTERPGLLAPIMKELNQQSMTAGLAKQAAYANVDPRIIRSIGSEQKVRDIAKRRVAETVKYGPLFRARLEKAMGADIMRAGLEMVKDDEGVDIVQQTKDTEKAIDDEIHDFLENYGVGKCDGETRNRFIRHLNAGVRRRTRPSGRRVQTLSA